MNKNSIALGFSPAYSGERRLVGIVSIVTGNNVAKITMEDDGKTFKNGENSIKVALEDLPIRLKPNNKDAKRFRIRMSQDGTEVEALGPVTGHCPARLVQLGPRPEKDALPTPELKVWGEGTKDENSHLEFWASYKIESGQFKGVVAPAYRLHYKFELDPNEEGMTKFIGNPENRKATRLLQLIEWGELHNLWSEPIPWDDETILDVLEERALESDVEVDLIFKNGYIAEILPLDADDFSESDTESKDEAEDDEPDFMKEPEPEVVVKKSNGKVTPVAKKVSPSTKRVPKKSADPDDDL